MIIFNLLAIPVVIAIAGVLWLASRIWPPLLDDPWFAWGLGVASIVVGGFAEFVGIKGRLFFAPIWLIGLGIVGYKIGWVGVVCVVGLAIGGMLWTSTETKKKEAVAWEKAQQTIKSAAPAIAAGEGPFWQWVRDTLVLPIWMPYTPALCEHNLRVVQAIRESGVVLSPDEIGRIAAAEAFLEKAALAAKPPDFDSKIIRQTESFVTARLHKAEAG